jgi:N-acetylglucosaminyldiphosphoundecaprenol N-acetyl-beta-D-mannosaminyltransferase
MFPAGFAGYDLPMLPKQDVQGVGVTSAPPQALLEEAARWIRDRGRARTIAAVNVHTFMEARRSPRFRDALNDASIAFVDGVPIRWLMRASGLEAPPRIHGADLTTLFLEGLPEARHLFFGSTPETLSHLESALRRRYPALKAAGFISPPFRKQAVVEGDDVLDRLNSSAADVLWVALGAPKQEVWARLNRERLRIPVVVCVGAVFEIFAGRFSRAPKALQAVGLEWAWRMMQDPGRLWRRYFATNGAFMASLAEQYARRLFHGS